MSKIIKQISDKTKELQIPQCKIELKHAVKTGWRIETDLTGKSIEELKQYLIKLQTK